MNSSDCQNLSCARRDGPRQWSLTSVDQLVRTGTNSRVNFDSGSGINVLLAGGFMQSVGDTFEFLSAAGGITGLNNVTFSGLTSGLGFTGAEQGEPYLQLDTKRVLGGLSSSCPEPDSGGLFLTGLAGRAALSRRCKREAA